MSSIMLGLVPSFAFATADSYLSIRDFILKYGDSTPVMAIKCHRRDIWYELVLYEIKRLTESVDITSVVSSPVILYDIIDHLCSINDQDMIDEIHGLCSPALRDVVDEGIASMRTDTDPSLLLLSVDELKMRAFNEDGHVIDKPAAVRYIDICPADQLPGEIVSRASWNIYTLPLSFTTECERRRELIRSLMHKLLRVDCITLEEHLPLVANNGTVYGYAYTRATRKIVEKAGHKLSSCNIGCIEPYECHLIDETRSIPHISNIHAPHLDIRVYERFYHLIPHALSRKECVRLMDNKPYDYIVNSDAQWHVTSDYIGPYLAQQAIAGKMSNTSVRSLQLAIAINDINHDEALRLAHPSIKAYISLI